MARQFLHLAVNFDFPKPIVRTAPPPEPPGAAPRTAPPPEPSASYLPGGLLNALALYARADPLIEAQKRIQGELDKATDWIRYAPNCWILYTTRGANSWYKRLVEIPGMEDHTFFVCELNILNRGGWLPKSVWEWIQKERS